MTYPSDANPYSQPASQPPYQYPPESAGMPQPAPGYGQPGYGQTSYPPPAGSPAGYSQPMPPGYPPQPGYPPAGYPQPPYAQYGQQYGTPYPGQLYVPGQVRPKASNPIARRALTYGGLSLGINIIAFFLGYYIIGVLAVYAIYYGIRALINASRLPGNPGIGMAVGGTIMAFLSLCLTVAELVLR